jgi:hypothetical protein
MYWKCLFFFFPLISLFSYAEEKFEAHLSNQQFIQTPEDMRRLGFFSALFDRFQKGASPVHSIPQTLHFIWLGPKKFPQDSIPLVRSWINHHPEWKVIFWTDVDRNAPDSRMEKRVVSDQLLGSFSDLYYSSDNVGERAHLLSYLILIQEGGIALDHDLECLASLELLRAQSDFFCGMEPLGSSILSSSVNPSPHLLAAAPHHPILMATTSWLATHWTTLEEQFPGSDSSSILNRVKHRTVYALGEGIKQAHSREGRKDVIFPPDYFSLSDRKSARFAIHQQLGTWYQVHSGSETEIHHLLSEVQNDMSHTYTLILLFAALNLVCGSIFFLISYRKKRRTS